jgi:hypothetical protein
LGGGGGGVVGLGGLVWGGGGGGGDGAGVGETGVGPFDRVPIVIPEEAGHVFAPVK